MRSIAYYWKEGLRNIFKHGFMSVAAVVIMVVSLLLTGTVTLVAYNITNNITRLQQSNQIVVWIDDSLTTREAKTLQTQFEKIDNIASIAFEDRDVALEQYRKELGDDADILEDYDADNNPLRNSYVFTLSDSMQADATIKEIEAVDGVASVRADIPCKPSAHEKPFTRAHLPVVWANIVRPYGYASAYEFTYGAPGSSHPTRYIVQ